MKLTIERLTALSPQDLIDLGKIWPHQQPEQWQSWLSDGRRCSPPASTSGCWGR